MQLQCNLWIQAQILFYLKNSKNMVKKNCSRFPIVVLLTTMLYSR